MDKSQGARERSFVVSISGSRLRQSGPAPDFVIKCKRRRREEIERGNDQMKWSCDADH